MEMTLTKDARKLREECEKIAEITGLDFWNVEKKDRKFREVSLELALNHMVLGEVVTQYTLLDKILTDVICRYYFKRRGKKFIRWEDDKFRIFVNFILDEAYLLKKMEVAHAIKPLPKEVRNIIHKINSIRNSMAHSFFPENRKENLKIGKVLYSGKNIRTSEGLQAFKTDCHDTWGYLARRAYGTWDGIKEGEGKWD